MTEQEVLFELVRLRTRVRGVESALGRLIERHGEHALSVAEERQLQEARADLRAGRARRLADISYGASL